MFIVTVLVKGAFGAFPDGEGFLKLDDAVARAHEWLAVGNVTEVVVTTPEAWEADIARNAGLVVGLGKALGYEIEFEAAEAA